MSEGRISHGDTQGTDGSPQCWAPLCARRCPPPAPGHPQVRAGPCSGYSEGWVLILDLARPPWDPGSHFPGTELTRPEGRGRYSHGHWAGSSLPRDEGLLRQREALPGHPHSRCDVALDAVSRPRAHSPVFADTDQYSACSWLARCTASPSACSHAALDWGSGPSRRRREVAAASHWASLPTSPWAGGPRAGVRPQQPRASLSASRAP